MMLAKIYIHNLIIPTFDIILIFLLVSIVEQIVTSMYVKYILIMNR